MSKRPESISAITGLGQGVGPEAQEPLAGHQLVEHDGQGLLVIHLV